LTGLLALAGILGVGEGHLFHHRKARRLVSGDFAKLGSLFQSFLSRLIINIITNLPSILHGRTVDLGRCFCTNSITRREFRCLHAQRQTWRGLRAGRPS
ncbi:hypothetical protein, partial [Pseudomonas amygdali]|uniref:hypothetical protein n=1 Tax=Pseudomonas amygdali TaxID=47877 RepID=UPI001C55686F